MADRQAKGICHRIGGDVVMGGADAARCEHIAVAVAQRIEGGHDVVFAVGHHPGLF
jgi:hypothetical protein